MASCGATCGITKERANDLVRARATAEHVHPGLVWTTRPPKTRAVPYDALTRLGAKLETLLPVRVHVHAGDTGECDWLYVLAGLYRPSLAEIVDAHGALPAYAPAVRETYVRVAVSPHERFAVMQEVVLTCEPGEDGAIVVYEPQAGVVDRRLQHIVKGLQGALRKAKLVVLDLGAVLTPIEDVAPSRELQAAYDETPSLWSFLFEGASPLARRVCWLPSTQ